MTLNNNQSSDDETTKGFYGEKSRAQRNPTEVVANSGSFGSRKVVRTKKDAWAQGQLLIPPMGATTYPENKKSTIEVS